MSKGTVRVTGTYANGVLTLTKAPVAAKPLEPNLNFPLPCPTPAGGWHGSDPVNVSLADQAVMGRFSAAHPTTFGGYWIARAPVPVIVAGVTNDVAGAQRELSSKLQGSVCVTKVAHTDRYLAQVSNEITELEKADNTPFLSDGVPTRSHQGLSSTFGSTIPQPSTTSPRTSLRGSSRSSPSWNAFRATRRGRSPAAPDRAAAPAAGRDVS